MKSIGVAVIPAKGNSIGLENKSLQTVGGRTLLERTIEQAKLAERIDQVFVVTEDEKIANLSKKHGATVFPCSPEMSDNKTMVWEKVRLVAESFKDCRGGIVPVFAEIHPTYPFRTPQLIDNTINFLEERDDADGVLVGSYLFDRVWRNTIGGRLATGIEIKQRQEQVPLFIDHYGLCNVFRRRLALTGNPYNGKLYLYTCNHKRQLQDIDNIEDLRICQAIARDGVNSKTFPDFL